MTRKNVVEVGGHNIFADLGLPDADTHFLKAQIVAEIYRLVRSRKLTQSSAGKLMGISQPEVSRLFRGKFLAGLKELFDSAKLEFHGQLEALVHPPAFLTLLQQAARTNWVVYAKRPYVLVVLVRGIQDQKESAALIARLSLAVYQASGAVSGISIP